MLTLLRGILFIKQRMTSEFIKGHIKPNYLITTLTCVLMDNFCPCFLYFLLKPLKRIRATIIAFAITIGIESRKEKYIMLRPTKKK